ncbi:hypothetical protein [Candidatus Minimicrobia naudis]
MPKGSTKLNPRIKRTPEEAASEIEHWFKPEELVNYHTLSEKFTR